MTALSSALAAMDKATPGPWELFRVGIKHPRSCPAHDGLSLLTVSYEGNTAFGSVFEDADATIIAAAPDALAWIKEALPWLEGIKAGMDGLTHKPDDYRKLCAMIARAKPEEPCRK